MLNKELLIKNSVPSFTASFDLYVDYIDGMDLEAQFFLLDNETRQKIYTTTVYIDKHNKFTVKNLPKQWTTSPAFYESSITVTGDCTYRTIHAVGSICKLEVTHTGTNVVTVTGSLSFI